MQENSGVGIQIPHFLYEGGQPSAVSFNLIKPLIYETQNYKTIFYNFPGATRQIQRYIFVKTLENCKKLISCYKLMVLRNVEYFVGNI